MGDLPKILFVSPYIPNPKSTVAEDGIDFFYYRNTLGQKIFKLRQMQSWHPLHFLAQNLPVESVVLENPTMEKFQREVRRGGYNVVAISFTALSTSRVNQMVKWLRTHDPAIEVLLGGYGTSVFADPSASVAHLLQSVDHICYGEGLAFMRSYLGTRWGVKTILPLRQSLVPTKVSLFRTQLPISRQLCFVRSLGCYYRCAFCSTSSQFGGRKVPIASPRELYDFIRQGAGAYPRINNAIIYDEDFLADRRGVMEFIGYLDADRWLRRHPLLLTVFTSVRSLSHYSLSELIRSRIGVLFIGVESFQEEILENETARKRSGREIAQLFRELHSVGIHTLGSMIIGWDGQTPENIEEDIGRFVALNPTLYQVMPLQAPPGSPLWRRMKAEGRLLTNELYEGVGVTRATFRYKHFTHEEVMGFVDSTHRKLVRQGGPSVFKMFENLFRGVKTLERMGQEEYLDRASILRTMLAPLFLLAFMSGFFFSGREFQRRWRRVMYEALRDAPLRVVGGALTSLFLLPFVLLYSLSGMIRHQLSPNGEQPKTSRRAYREADVPAVIPPSGQIPQPMRTLEPDVSGPVL